MNQIGNSNPVVFQQCHNSCDVDEFLRVFLSKCDENVIVMGHSVDANERPIHREALRLFVGRLEYEKYYMKCSAPCLMLVLPLPR